MAVNHITEQADKKINPTRSKSKILEEQLEENNLVIINRKQFAEVWRKWTLNESKLFDLVYDLAQELSDRVTRFSLATEASREMMDLCFTKDQQNTLWLAWEKEEKEAGERLKDEKLQAAATAMKELTSYQRLRVLVQTDEEIRRRLIEHNMQDLATGLEDDAKEIFFQIKDRTEICD